MNENFKSFDPTEWAEKRRLAIARASQVRQQRLAERGGVRVVRAESRESVSTQGGGENTVAQKKKWEINTKPSSSRVRANTSPAEKRSKPVVSRPKTEAGRPNAVGKRPVSATVTKEVRKPPPSSSDPVTRQMIDRDTLRRENGPMFAKAIAYWRSLQVEDEFPEIPPSRVSVYVRKRPLFEQERFQKKEFDVVSIGSKSIVVHNCLFQADLKTPYLTHTKFTSFSGCFPEIASSEQVFLRAADPLVAHAISGGISTFFCFGQTGSGKTFTMTAIQDLTSKRLHGLEISVQILELCGKKVLDLLSEQKQGVKLREGADGRLVLDGASTVNASTAMELGELMQRAQERRNTESTGANAVSSRSHVVVILSIPKTGGRLTLVDLAGSERRKDSMFHDKDRQREGAEINASIHALKECIRQVTGKIGGSAFRLSTLTRILAESFVNLQSKLAVLATVSPCATDVEHTVSTLKTVHQLTGTAEGVTETKQTEMYPPAAKRLEVHPKKWTPDQVQQWLASEGESDCVAISKSTTGAMLVRMPESRFVQACNGDDKRGSRLFRSLHALMTTSR